MLEEKRCSLSTQIRESLIKVFLTVFKFVEVCRTNDAIATITKMQEANLLNYLLLAAANRQNVLLQIKKNHDQSDDLIINILNKIIVKNIKSHCLHKRLLLSRAENVILRKKFNKAIFYVEQ